MREAALPRSGYEPPENLFSLGGRNIVRVYPEAESGFRDFSFDSLKIGPELQSTFAEGFASVTGPSGTRRTIASAKNLYAKIKVFAKLVGSGPQPPVRVADLRPSHLSGLRLRHTRSAVGTIHALRVVLRSNPDVPVPFRNALFAPLTSPEKSRTSQAYSEAELRAIQRAARSDVRAAVARIRAGEDELVRWRREEEQLWTAHVPGGLYQSRGSVLNHVAMIGDVPRYSSGQARTHGIAKGGSEIFSSLFPTLSDVAAMVILFQCLTGQNLSTIYDLTTRYSRADGALDGETKVLITRGSKPRRGPNRAEMDLSFAAISEEPTEYRGERDDFGSPFGLYLIAEELCGRARKFAGTDALFVGYSSHRRANTPNGLGFRRAEEAATRHWKGWTDDHGVPQIVDSRRLRRTFLEVHQRPVAQTVDTLADEYLIRDPGSLVANQDIVQRVLAGELDRIRTATAAVILTDFDVTEAATDIESVAERLGITAASLQSILEGKLDTVATACIDNNDGPITLPGQPCTASFLLCLGCPNARSEPRHIPVQALLRQQIEGLRDELSVADWEEAYGTAADQLDDLLTQQRADVSAAAAQATSEDAELVRALLDGRLDLR